MNDALRNSIRTLTRTYYDYQNERLALDGRLEIKKSGESKKDAKELDPALMVAMVNRRVSVKAFEDELAKELAKEVHKHDLWKAFLLDVKGCGEGMAAVIISEFDIYKAPHVSNLWSFAGLAPGKDRKEKGKTCPYNQFLRAKLCGVLGGSFLKSNSPYREYYDNMRVRLEGEKWGMDSKNPGNKDNPKAGHQHKAAIRYMIKMFLKDLYVAWRTLEGLPVSKPYQEAYLGHDHNENHPERISA
jgi:hypothetical protein